MCGEACDSERIAVRSVVDRSWQWADFSHSRRAFHQTLAAGRVKTWLRGGRFDLTERLRSAATHAAAERQGVVPHF